MKTQTVFFALIWASACTLLTSCSKDAFIDEPIQESSAIADSRASEVTVYPLASVSDPDISGTVTFRQIGSKTMVTIQLDGTSPGGMHPAHIHFNSVAEGGGIAVPLNSVRGASGRSVTIVEAMTYDELINFDGHVNVHLSAQQLATYIAQGNIGSNY